MFGYGFSRARALAAVLLVAVCSFPLTPGAYAQSADSEHLPGTPGYGDIVPADLKVPADSPAALPGAQPDASGNVPHVCAGKKILHHAHVDAAYVTRVNGEFTVTVVDGQSVVKDPSSVCVRLAPDARNEDGLEVSRFAVPDSPAYSFLGQPGDIVWRAPQEEIDPWRPVWAGVGAFDAHHEAVVPQDFMLDEVQLKLASTIGPGAVEVWRADGSGLARGFSSDPTYPASTLPVGAHGHWNWTFTQAGVYHLGFQASGTLKQGGSITSEVSDIVWLVGSDQDVQLPVGTTTGTNPITIPTEQTLSGAAGTGMGEGSVSGDTGVTGTDTSENPGASASLPDGEPGDGEGSGSASGGEGDSDPAVQPAGDTAVREQILSVVRLPQYLPSELKSSGHYAVRAELREGEMSTSLVDMSDSSNPQAFKSSQKVAIEVPDTLHRSISDDDTNDKDLAGTSVWLLPSEAESNQSGAGGAGQGDKAPSLIFDLSPLAHEKFDDALRLNPEVLTMPEGARYLTLAPEQDTSGKSLFGRSVRIDSADAQPREILSQGARLDRAHVFTKPGLYRIDFNVDTKIGEQFTYSMRTVFFAVGNEAINAVRTMNWETQKARAQENGDDPSVIPAPELLPLAGVDDASGAGSGPDSDSGTHASGDPHNPSEQTAPTIDLPAARSQLARLNISELKALIQEGHMDQAFALDSADHSDGKAYVLDTANPSRPRVHESGSFAYAVPDSAWGIVPDTAAYAAIKQAAPQGAWALPESELEGLPWVGFSTEKADYSLIDGAVTVTLKNVSVPSGGRMISGHYNLLASAFETALDTDQPQKSLLYTKPSHDHQALYFSQPGVYKLDFVYSAALKDGRTVELPLTTTFLVGDSAIHAGAEILGNTDDSGSQSGDAGGAGDSGENPENTEHQSSAGNCEALTSTSAQPLPIDELVVCLNSAAGHQSGGAGSLGGADSTSNTGSAQPVPSLHTSSATNEGLEGTKNSAAAEADSAAGSVDSAGSGDLLPSVDTGLPSLLPDANSLGSAADTGTYDAGSAALIQGGDAAEAKPASAVKSLKKPVLTHVSALTNPSNGSASYRAGVPWWQWALLGVGIVAVLGVSSYLFSTRKR